MRKRQVIALCTVFLLVFQAAATSADALFTDEAYPAEDCWESEYPDEWEYREIEPELIEPEEAEAPGLEYEESADDEGDHWYEDAGWDADVFEEMTDEEASGSGEEGDAAGDFEMEDTGPGEILPAETVDPDAFYEDSHFDPDLADRVESAVEEPDTSVMADEITENALRSIFGLGVDPEIDPEVDAVQEIYEKDPEDEGILELAAEVTGISDEAVVFFSASPSAMEEGQARIAESPDRQNGVPCEFVPDDDPSKAMVRLSSFMLSKVRDGAGDFDSTTDLKGNDSSESNGIVRTNDDVSYVFSYSTALGDGYLYRTIRGTRLYLEYLLPVSSSEAVFNTDAMPWLRGDSPEGGPVITTGDFGQRLVGYRDLPDRRDRNGQSYDVPGAGTVNCVIRIKKMLSGQKLRPSFSAWIQRKTDNSASASRPGTASADTSVCDPEVVISVGPHLRLKLTTDQGVAQVRAGIPETEDLLSVKTGKVTHIKGSTRAFYYRIECGKQNGSKKGVDYIDPTKRIAVSFEASCGVSVSSKTTEIGLYNVRTFSMTTADGKHISGALRDETETSPISDTYGTIPKASVSVKNGVVGFEIRDFTRSAPGALISQGVITFIQKEENALSNEEKPTYWTSLSGKSLAATCLYSGDGAEVDFPVSTVWRIERQMERSGNFDSHLLLTSDSGLAYVLTTGDLATDGRIGYGMDFNVYLEVDSTAVAEKNLEYSRDYFVLWDNRKVMLRSGGDSAIYKTQEPESVYRYITKADGSLWKNDAEMLSVDFTSASMYSIVRVWPDYAAAEAFLKGKHPSEDDVSAYICGYICEAHRLRGMELGDQYYRRSAMHMKVRRIPENIRKAAMFVQAVRGYSKVIKTSYSGADGKGSDPSGNQSAVIRNWNLSPMEYEKSRWDSDGVLIESSITTLNTLHKGNTLYIEPYTLRVKEYFPDGTEAKTFDLSEADELEIRIEPGFAEGPQVANASFLLEIPKLRMQTGDPAVTAERLTVRDKDGKEIELKDGDTCQLSQLVSGAEGEVKISVKKDQYELAFSGTATKDQMPVLSLKGKLDKAKIDSSVTISHTSVISGDGIVEKPSSENGHLASVGAAFVEIQANALRMTVDKAETENNEELLYTITYTNLYDRDHLLDLTDVFPFPKDRSAEDFPEGISQEELIKELETAVSKDARLVFVENSAKAVSDQGSAVKLTPAADRLRAEGSLKSGETVTITYRIRVSGAADGDLIRNSCIQRDSFGDVVSNRVETIVRLPAPIAPMTLLTGGAGTGRWYFSALLLLLAALPVSIMAGRERRR